MQPDISVICDKSKLTDKGCNGAPDMVIEVVSPYKPGNDYIKKAYLYELHGVREYWIVNLVYILENDGYDMPTTYTFQDTVKVNVFNDLEINFSTIEL